ncbi:hypothetical protein VMCG_06143 [Cytospora schulzeri]|uniref:Uncharacterized protein n=1 Tax=Cytospora schulzeri TaxID=448051 RepID=A0A423WGK3_9PEZI|nr:hypothetical protein VMCG_06143 [Valsa malicola]
MKMVSCRDQAKFDRAQWLLKVLVPCWMIQISLFMILVGLSSFLLSNAMKASQEERGTAVAWECITIAVAVICMVCTAYEIFKTVAEALTPRDMMISSLIKISGTILSMIMTSVMSGTTMWKWSIGSQIAHGLSLISILILATYGAWKWRVLAQYDDYHHPANVKPFGFKSDVKNKALHSRNLSDEDWDVERQADWVAGDEPLGNAINISSPAPTTASPEPNPTGTRARGSSFIKMGGRLDFSLNRDVNTVNEKKGDHSRSNSSSALMNVDTSYQPQTQIPSGPTNTKPTKPTKPTTTTTNEPTSPPPVAAGASSPPPTGRQRSASYISVTGTGLDRRASYNHTRDTSFDEYVQQRRSSRTSQHKHHRSHGSINGASNSNSGSGSGSNSGSASSRSSLGSIGPRLILNHHHRHASSSGGTSLKNDVDDAIGAEFGWNSHASRTSSQDSVMAGGTPPAIAVAGGAVAGVKSVHDSLGRAPSDGSETGVLGSVPERREDEKTCPCCPAPVQSDTPESCGVQIAVLVRDPEDVRQRVVRKKGVQYRDVVPVVGGGGAAADDGLEWFEFLDLDGQVLS